jgi:4-amino-4-deoxy-L-arabinose transferase-like glycosyltransferase
MEQRTSEPIVPRLHQILAIIGFLCVLIGQYILLVTPAVNDVTPGTVWVSIVGVIIFLSSFIVKPKDDAHVKDDFLSRNSSVGWIIASIILSLITTIGMVLFEPSNRMNYLPVVITWFGSGASLIIGFRKNLFPRINWKIWIKAHKTELIIISLLTLVAAVMRFWGLGSYPRIIDGDEGLLGLAAQSTTTSTLANPFALWENFGALYLQLVNVAFLIFGATPFALRLLPAISGILAVPAVYLLGREISGKRVGFIAAFLIMVSHTDVHFSRIGSVAYIHSTWLIPLELFLLLRGINKRNTWLAAASGVLLAIDFSVYLTSQITVALIFVFMVIAFFCFKDWFRPAWRQAAAFWGGFLVMLIPEFVYILQHPADYFDRLNQNGTFQSGWLTTTMASTGQSAVQILAGRVVHAFMSLIYFPAIDFYGSKASMLSLFSAVFVLIGLAVILVRIRSPKYVLLNGYFWALTLAVGIFSIPPSADSYRMLMVLPAAVIISANAIDHLLYTFGIGWQRNKAAYAFITSLLLIGIMIINVRAYYVDFLGNCLYGESQAGRFASYLGNYSKTVNGNSTIYLLSDDAFHYGTHASTDFLSGSRAITNFPDNISNFTAKPGDVVIAPPDRFTDLDQWIGGRPGGELSIQHDCQATILKAYTVP